MKRIKDEMAPINVILMSCGSFNPPTNMHLRMFEVARDHLHRMGNHLVVGGVLSPVHDAYGKKELESSRHRLAMIELALQDHDWVKLSDWECKQESWSRTKLVLQYHQNQLNALLNSNQNSYDFTENETKWIPDNIINSDSKHVQIKLLCGADLLESFVIPGLWTDTEIEDIVGQHGLVVITRSKSNPLEIIYNSDILTKYMANIVIITEWIRNEISSTKIRRALRRSDSVRYLLPDNVIDYIDKYHLYGSEKTKYLAPPNKKYYLTPSPSEMNIQSSIPTSYMYNCNNNLFSKLMSVDTVDCLIDNMKYPNQVVKIITKSSGEHKIIRSETEGKEICKEKDFLKSSKSYSNFVEVVNSDCEHTGTSINLKKYKRFDENLVKFIFTKHGIEVISDVETIV